MHCLKKYRLNMWCGESHLTRRHLFSFLCHFLVKSSSVQYSWFEGDLGWVRGEMQLCIWREELLKWEDRILRLANIMVSWCSCGQTLGPWQANGSLSTGGSQVGDARAQLSGPGKLGAPALGIKPLPGDRDGPGPGEGLAGQPSLGGP